MAKVSLKGILLLGAAAVLAVGCSGPAPAPTLEAQAAAWPTEDWPTSSPEEQGMDSEKLASMFEAIEKRDLNIHSVLVARSGYLVAEAYFYPFQPGMKHDLRSVTKSVTSALVGIALEQGHVASVDQPVLSFFPDAAVAVGDLPAAGDTHKEAVKLEQLLTMSSGLDWADDRQMGPMVGSPDWVQFVLERPMAGEPGARFNYNSGNTHLLSAIIQRTAGMSTLEFAQRYLFGPLGIDDADVYWESDPKGVSIGGWGLWLAPRDLAKIGALYLNDGRWEGQQVVPAGWVRDSVERRIQVQDPLEPWDLHLGYGWWLHDLEATAAHGQGMSAAHGQGAHAASGIDAYAAHGQGGQFLFVVPDLDLVVVFCSGLAASEFVQPELLLRDYIHPAASSHKPLPTNPKGVALLEARIQAVEKPEPQPVPPLPPIARDLSGKTYRLEANLSDLRDFSLEFLETEALLKVNLGGSRATWSVGLDDVPRVTPTEAFSPVTAVAARGAWLDSNTFVIHLQYLGALEKLEVGCRFEGEGVLVQIASSAGWEERVQGCLRD
jgi:CubicO group peptidase (beta-lactamase class C family)